MKFSTKIILVLSAIFLVLGGASTTALFELKGIERNIKKTRNNVDVIQHRIAQNMKLKEAVFELKFDVVQVQQWLTDISATRGLDGMDDGDDKAAEYAEKFSTSLSETRALATELSLPTVLKDLDEVEAAFGPYYIAGQRMAKAYVDMGPEVGNKFMKDFDGVASNITETVGQMHAEVGKLTVDFQSEIADDLRTTAALTTDQYRMQLTILIISTFLAVFSGLYVFTLVRGRMGALQHDLNQALLGGAGKEFKLKKDQKDEFGDVSRALHLFRENLIAVERMKAEQQALEARAEAEKREAMGKLADDFDRRTAGIIKSLAAAATEMQATAQQMSSVSGNTTHASQIVAAAASEADNNVQVVAAATEELSASSREIAQQISNVAHKSSRAASEAQRTSQQVNELNTLADSIGDVISSIKAIAEQTNLLALNATIEAARAGEAGKGFAVVADEVKKLATETASKTIEIDERVGRIQDAIRSSVEAVGRIINDVQEIDHATSAVAGAVEEQNAATAEIGRNVNEASQGTQQVAQNIHDVQRNAEETGDSARALNDAASELAEIAESLQNQVTEFLHEIRSS